MLYNIKPLPLHCVFHGIRFKVKKIGCRDDNQFFLFPIPNISNSQRPTINNHIPYNHFLLSPLAVTKIQKFLT